MSHFCENCGRPLVEGETCHCTMENVTYQGNEANVTLPKENIKKEEKVVEKTNTVNTSTKPKESKNYFKPIGDLFKGIKKPADAIKNFVENGSLVPGLIILIAIVLLNCVVQEADLIHDLALGYYYNLNAGGIAVKIISKFFSTLILSSISYGLIAGGIYVLVNKIFKVEDAKFDKIINILGIATFAFVISYIITLLLTIIDGTIVNAIYNHASVDFAKWLRNLNYHIDTYVSSFVYILQITICFFGIKETTSINNNKLLIVVPSIMVIANIIVGILSYIF